MSPRRPERGEALSAQCAAHVIVEHTSSSARGERARIWSCSTRRRPSAAGPGSVEGSPDRRQDGRASDAGPSTARLSRPGADRASGALTSRSAGERSTRSRHPLRAGGQISGTGVMRPQLAEASATIAPRPPETFEGISRPAMSAGAAQMGLTSSDRARARGDGVKIGTSFAGQQAPALSHVTNGADFGHGRRGEGGPTTQMSHGPTAPESSVPEAPSGRIAGLPGAEIHAFKVFQAAGRATCFEALGRHDRAADRRSQLSLEATSLRGDRAKIASASKAERLRRRGGQFGGACNFPAACRIDPIAAIARPPISRRQLPWRPCRRPEWRNGAFSPSKLLGPEVRMSGPE